MLLLDRMETGRRVDSSKGVAWLSASSSRLRLGILRLSLSRGSVAKLEGIKLDNEILDVEF